MTYSRAELDAQLRTQVTAGEEAEALRLLASQDWSDTERRRWSYHLGNLLHAAGRTESAGKIWRDLREVAPLPESPSLVQIFRRWWPPALMTVGVILTFYALLFTNFPRPFDLFQFMQTMRNQQTDRSAWDSFWDTERPSWRNQEMPFVEADDLVPMLQDTISRLLGEDEENLDTERGLAQWLRDYEAELYGGGVGGLDYHIVVAKGLFNSRAFDEAVAVLEQGLEEADSPRKRAQLYQELGTTYYYQGYELQPDGLARYNLPLVRKSVESYEQAAPFSSNPYLFGNLGWGYYLLEEYDRAIEYSEQALQLVPSLNYVRMNLGITYLRMGRLEEALAAYENIRDFRPDRTEYEGGIRDLQELLREFPGQYLFGHFLLGYLFQMQENYPLAKESLERYLTTAPPTYWQAQTRQMLREMNSGL